MKWKKNPLRMCKAYLATEVCPDGEECAKCIAIYSFAHVLFGFIHIQHVSGRMSATKRPNVE